LGARSGEVYIYGGTLTGGADGDVILAHDGQASRGNVGIGTAAPGAQLDIAGDLLVDGGTLYVDDTNDRVGIGTLSPGQLLQLGDDTNNIDGIMRFEASDGDEVDLGITTSDEFYITGGKVGIGITGPNDELEVVGDASADRFVARTGAADVEFADEDGTDGIKIENTDSYEHIWIGDYSVSSSNFRGIYVDGYYQTTSIGIVDTSNQLVVSSPDNDDTVRLLGPDGGATAYGARLNFGDSDYVYIEEDADNKLYLYGSSRTAIMGGNVGIGQTTPLSILHLKDDDPGIILEPEDYSGDTDYWLAVMEDAGNDDNDIFQIGDGTSVGTNPFVTINTDGNVGVGETNPLTKLQVDGDVAFEQGLDLDISSEEITVTHTYHAIKAESGTSDELDKVNGGSVSGQILILRTYIGHTITVKDGAVGGNIQLSDDFTMHSVQDTLTLMYDATYSSWLEISRSDNYTPD
jgi:hypothetical protein